MVVNEAIWSFAEGVHRPGNTVIAAAFWTAVVMLGGICALAMWWVPT